MRVSERKVEKESFFSCCVLVEHVLSQTKSGSSETVRKTTASDFDGDEIGGFNTLISADWDYTFPSQRHVAGKTLLHIFQADTGISSHKKMSDYGIFSPDGCFASFSSWVSARTKTNYFSLKNVFKIFSEQIVSKKIPAPPALFSNFFSSNLKISPNGRYFGLEFTSEKHLDSFLEERFLAVYDRVIGKFILFSSLEENIPSSFYYSLSPEETWDFGFDDILALLNPNRDTTETKNSSLLKYIELRTGYFKYEEVKNSFLIGPYLWTSEEEGDLVLPLDVSWRASPTTVEGEGPLSWSRKEERQLFSSCSPGESWFGQYPLNSADGAIFSCWPFTWQQAQPDYLSAFRAFDLTEYSLPKINAFTFKRIRGREFFALAGPHPNGKTILLIFTIDHNSSSTLAQPVLLLEREYEVAGELKQIYLE